MREYKQEESIEKIKNMFEKEIDSHIPIGFKGGYYDATIDIDIDYSGSIEDQYNSIYNSFLKAINRYYMDDSDVKKLKKLLKKEFTLEKYLDISLKMNHLD